MLFTTERPTTISRKLQYRVAIQKMRCPRCGFRTINWYVGDGTITCIQCSNVDYTDFYDPEQQCEVSALEIVLNRYLSIGERFSPEIAQRFIDRDYLNSVGEK